jgi:hypothetical protein
VGAWVWASGSQVCSGKIGTLMAKAMAKARNSQRAEEVAMAPWSLAMVTRSKVICPVARPWSTAVAMSPTSMKAEPNIVYRKNFIAA